MLSRYYTLLSIALPLTKHIASVQCFAGQLFMLELQTDAL